MLYGVKSAGPTAWLSVTVKLFSQRWKYPTSTETRGSTCCWIDAPHCQSFERTLQPLRIFGSMLAVVCAVVPNVAEFIAPQKSPPSGRRSWAVLSRRLQSGVRLLLASVHVRVVVVAMRVIGFERV